MCLFLRHRYVIQEATEGEKLRRIRPRQHTIQQTLEGSFQNVCVLLLVECLSWFERVKSLKSANLSVECDLSWVGEAPAPGKEGGFTVWDGKGKTWGAQCGGPSLSSRESLGFLTSCLQWPLSGTFSTIHDLPLASLFPEIPPTGLCLVLDLENQWVGNKEHKVGEIGVRALTTLGNGVAGS